MRRVTVTVLLIIVVFTIAGCGTHEPGGDCGRGDRNGAFYPLQAGAWWYEVETYTDQATTIIEDKVVYCCAKQTLPLRPEVNGFPLVRHTEDGYALRWQEIDAEGSVRRHYDESFLGDGSRDKFTYYCPSKLHVLDQQVPDDGYVEDWYELDFQADDEAGWQDCLSLVIDQATCEPTGDPGLCVVSGPTAYERTWTTLGEGLEITVPAGTFETTHFHTVELEEGDESDNKHWYWSRGVGKVKEQPENEDQEYEELHDFCIPIGPDPGDPPLYSDLPDKCPAAQ